MRSHGKNIKTYKLCQLGFLLAFSLILSYIESILSFDFAVPGVKLGLANSCSVILLYMGGFPDAFAVNILRVLISGFLFGNLSMIIYSLAGAVISLLSMYILKKTNLFSIIGVSIVGGVMHNIAQCIVASLVVSNLSIFVYFPVLLVAGAIAGIVIGYISKLLIPYLSRLWKDNY